MFDLQREIGASRRRELTPVDEVRTLRHLSAFVSFTLALGAWSVIAGRSALEPGSAERLFWCGLFGVVSGVLALVIPRRDLLPVDFTVRLLAICLLAYNIERDLDPRHWLLCLPLFLPTILIPALFYTAIPTTVTVSLVVLLSARMAAAADAPTTVRVLAWCVVIGITTLFVIVIQRLVSQRRQAFRAMASLAATDPLTKLPNRRHFMDAAPLLLLEGHETGRSCTLVLFDIDHFKSINDVYGHDAGDRVLVGVAHAMRGACRTDDLIARLGGEEFAILMLGASALHAQYIAAELASAFRGVDPVAITASYGAVEARHGELDIGDLLVRADAALYQAKRSGRNRCIVEA